MDIGAALADDQTCYFIIGRQEKLYFGSKTTVQCSNQLKHKIALQFRSTTADQSLVVETQKLQYNGPTICFFDSRR